MEIAAGFMIFYIALIFACVLYGISSQPIKQIFKKASQQIKQKQREYIEEKNKKTGSSARNFLRPYNSNSYKKFVFANKLCIVEFSMSDASIIYFDKLQKRGSVINFYSKGNNLSGIFKKFCQCFDYDTDYKTAKEMSINNFYDNNYVTRALTGKENKKYALIHINNLSVAEFLAIPGMNLGKANKAAKYIRKNRFTTIQEFCEFVNINDKYRKKIKEMYIQKILLLRRFTK